FGSGFMLSSAFPSILLYAQELLPNKRGLVSGLFFGFAFGGGGICAAILGEFADHYGIITVYNWCAFSPLLGIVAAFLPNLRGKTGLR
ncbi:MAG: MFS transporter, partial [Paramuribaculum sp.]|nr:MFS transporter [Paramuribaculum sp.]